YENAIDDLRKRGIELAGGNGVGLAKALFLNGQAGAAMELLQKNGLNAKMVCEILIAQTRLAEAFALVESARKSSSAQLPELEILWARTQYFLGEKDQARATLTKYAGEVKKGSEPDWYLDLVEAELAVGRRDEAFAVAGKVLLT